MPHRGTLIIRKSAVAWPGALKIASAILLMLLPAFARDNGQWENVDPVISGWIRGLMQPDNPLISCCGQADAYWADGVEIKEGQVIAIVTDTRPDIPLGRPHIPVGTRIVVPPHKLKWDRGNPTGHTIIFLSYPARDVLCYVTGTGI